MSQDPLVNPAASYYEGIPTFFRAKTVPPDELQRGDLAVVGAPYDSTNHQGRPGARFGPRAIREASCYFSSYYYALPNREYVNIDEGTRHRVPDPLRLFDLGDVSGYPTDVQATTGSVGEVLGAVVARGALPILLGGDHYVAYTGWKGVAEGLSAREGNPELKVGYIQIDSHTDLLDDFAHGGRFSHGTFARRIAEHPNASVKHMAWLGLNGTLLSGELYDFVSANDLIMVPTEELKRANWEDRVRDVFAHVAQCDYVYVSADIDAVDGAQAPGTTGVVFGGIDAPQFVRLLEMVADIPNLAGLDLCEVAPNLDPFGRTARLAALSLVTFVGGRLFESEPLT